MAFKCFDCAYKYVLYETDGCDQSCDNCDLMVRECENCSYSDDDTETLKECISCQIHDIKKRPINEHRFHKMVYGCDVPSSLIGDYPF